VFFSVWVFSRSNVASITASTLWTGSGALLVAWLAFFGLLMSKLKPEFYVTFYSAKTAHQQTKEYFTLGEDDETKMSIFRNNAIQWKSIAGDVKEFTFANWERWTVEKPAWFTADVIATVPDAFIPENALLALKAAEGGHRRRSSVGLFGQVVEAKPS
jgi:hypothetical protein